MDWTPGNESSDIEDRRGETGGGGGGGFLPAGIGGIHLGIGGTILLVILSLVFRTNFFSMLGGGGGDAGPAPTSVNDGPTTGSRASSGPPPNESAGEHREMQLASWVLDNVQTTWDKVLPQQEHIPYHHARMVLYRDQTRSACGGASEATGPFYCPEDERVYLDLGFFDELTKRFHASNGDFAQAYVIAHELGHHVQKLIGIEPRVRQMQQSNPGQAKALSVRLELQADCFAGIWGHFTEEKQIINQADIQQGLSAAAAVGDDRLQRAAGRQVNPDSFTHGSSAQRTQWFQKGLDNGQISACNTFAE